MSNINDHVPHSRLGYIQICQKMPPQENSLEEIEDNHEVFTWMNPELKKDIEFIEQCVIRNSKVFEKITINDFSERRLKVKVIDKEIVIYQKEDPKYKKKKNKLLSLIKRNNCKLLQHLKPIDNQGRLYVIVDSFTQYKLLLRELLENKYRCGSLFSCDLEALRGNSILSDCSQKSTLSKNKKYLAFVEKLFLQAVKWTKNEQERICEALVGIEKDIFIKAVSSLVKQKKLIEGNFSCLTETNLLRDEVCLAEKLLDFSMYQLGVKRILEDEELMLKLESRRDVYEKIVNFSDEEEWVGFYYLQWGNFKIREESLVYSKLRPELFKEWIESHSKENPECLQFAGKDVLEDNEFLLKIAEVYPEAITRAGWGPLGKRVKEAETLFRCEVALREKSKIKIPIFLRKKIFACMFVYRQDSNLSFIG